MSRTETLTEDFEVVAVSIVAGQIIQTDIMKIEFIKGSGVIGIRKKRFARYTGKN